MTRAQIYSLLVHLFPDTFHVDATESVTAGQLTIQFADFEPISVDLASGGVVASARTAVRRLSQRSDTRRRLVRECWFNLGDDDDDQLDGRLPPPLLQLALTVSTTDHSMDTVSKGSCALSFGRQWPTGTRSHSIIAATEHPHGQLVNWSLSDSTGKSLDASVWMYAALRTSSDEQDERHEPVSLVDEPVKLDSSSPVTRSALTSTAVNTSPLPRAPSPVASPAKTIKPRSPSPAASPERTIVSTLTESSHSAERPRSTVSRLDDIGQRHRLLHLLADRYRLDMRRSQLLQHQKT